MPRDPQRPPALSGKPHDFSRKYWVFAVPALVVISAVIVFPWLFTVFMSLQDWKIGGGTEFVGFENYTTLFQGPALPRVDLASRFYFTALAVVVPVFLGTVAALDLPPRVPAAAGVLRTVFVMPMMATPVAVSLVWKMMFHPQLGVLNYLLSLRRHRPPRTGCSAPTR